MMKYILLFLFSTITTANSFNETWSVCADNIESAQASSYIKSLKYSKNCIRPKLPVPIMESNDWNCKKVQLNSCVGYTCTRKYKCKYSTRLINRRSLINRLSGKPEVVKEAVVSKTNNTVPKLKEDLIPLVKKSFENSDLKLFSTLVHPKCEPEKKTYSVFFREKASIEKVVIEPESTKQAFVSYGPPFKAEYVLSATFPPSKDGKSSTQFTINFALSQENNRWYLGDPTCYRKIEVKGKELKKEKFSVTEDREKFIILGKTKILFYKYNDNSIYISAKPRIETEKLKMKGFAIKAWDAKGKEIRPVGFGHNSVKGQSKSRHTFTFNETPASFTMIETQN